MNLNCLENTEIMKYLPKELYDDYIHYAEQFPDHESISKPLINISDVLQAHYILADYFTDATADAETERMLVGVKNGDLLSSAICRQISSFEGHNKYNDKYEICATLFFGLVKNHAFHDGNKRTALLTLLNQLQLYSLYPSADIYAFEKLVLSVASNELDKMYPAVWKKFNEPAMSMDDQSVKTIAYLLRRMVKNKNTSYHCDISMRIFIQTLQNKGVDCERIGSKYKLTRIVSHGFPQKKYTYTIKFYGETRVVEAGMASDTLRKLHFLDEYATYNDFFNGTESFYSIIQKFEIPLRRLKDE